MDKSSELKDLSQAQKIAHLLSLREGGMTIVAISQQYNTPRCTLYYWLCRYETYHTHEDRSPAPHCTHGKVTEEIRMAVLEKHSKNRLLGCWRLSLFLYQEQRLSHTTIWRILVAARQPRPLSQSIYQLTHYHQIWFIDHMHLRTLPDGQKAIPADTFVLAIGSEPDRQFCEEVRGRIPEVHVIGDASQAHSIREAMKDGFRIGLLI